MKKRLLAIYEYWLHWKMSAKITSSILVVALASLAALILIYYINDTQEEAEQAGTRWMQLGKQLLAEAEERVTDDVQLLETLARTPSLVEAVQAANNERADWIQAYLSALDTAWSENDPSVEPLINELTGNSLSAYLLDFQSRNRQEKEIFITDMHGLNIAMTNRTSDFLQADEEWWQATFADGKGSVYLGEVEYDESSQSYALDIGIPILDPQTGKAIGVLRGTLDVSVMVQAFNDVELSEEGNLVLLDANGIALFSHTADQFMQPAPDHILALFEGGESGWEETNDMEGDPAIVAYNSHAGDVESSLGWHLLISQSKAETNQKVIRNLLIGMIAAIFVVALGGFVSALVVGNSISAPLGLLTGIAHELSVGDIQGHNTEAKTKLSARRDEVGEISKAFDRLILYFQGASEAAVSIANKDLDLEVNANSDKDELGNAFNKMIHELNHVMAEFTASAETVSSAASQLAESSNQSGRATNQIATTIQQIALGTTQQSEEVSKTSSSVEQMGRAIEGVARGAQEQAQAISKASLVTAAINTAIEQVASNADSGAQGAERTAAAARLGAQTVEATIRDMQTIKDKVGLSVQKVREMGKRSEEIDTIVDTIDEIAAQTNLLALNAAIEAARVEAKGEKTVESLLQQHMVGTVRLVADILASGRELESQDLVTLTRLAGVEELYISDSDGVITASSQPGSLGFRFSEDIKQQSSAFRPLLNQRDGVVIRPILVRDQDGKPYIYVGVSRRDKAGIVQAGTSADLVYKLGGYSRGFAVVASEVGKLAEHAKRSTKEVATLIRDLQKTVSEAVTVMEDGARNVEAGSAQAGEAGRSLEAILDIAETVNQQVKEIASAVQHMSISSNELVSAMETVSAVVEQNTAATEEMAANSSELTQAVENIASVSEQNSAAVEEVSAATEEVLAQAEQVSAAAASLKDMAQGLQKITAQFRLAKDGR